MDKTTQTATETTKDGFALGPARLVSFTTKYGDDTLRLMRPVLDDMGHVIRWQF